MIRLTHRVNIEPLERYHRGMQSRLSAAVRRTTFRVERAAKRNAPVDTGALRASIYSVMQGYSGFAAAADRAAERIAFGGGQALTVSGINQPHEPMTGWVVAGVHYAAYVEFGTFHTRNTTRMSTRKSGATAMSIATRRYGTFVQGRFFMTRALRENEAFFREQIRAAIRGA